MYKRLHFIRFKGTFEGKMENLVLVRHGQSQWNQENRFTGWVDVDLSPVGITEAKEAGIVLKNGGYRFDLAFTSVLKRAIRTLWHVMDETDQMYLPVTPSWRLNERHYGNLQGLNKTEMVNKFGEDQVKIWRRSFDVPPPPLEENDKRHPKLDPRYKNVDPRDLPNTESLKETEKRFLPFWHEVIAPQLKNGKQVLVVAHGNSLRALVKYLDQISNEKITELNIPTGIPLAYDLDQNLKPKSSRYLGDPEVIKARIEGVANQLKKG